MKTNQEMVRYIGNYSVIQRTSDGYFNASSLLESWNAVKGNPERNINKFFDSPKVMEFINALEYKLKSKSPMANLPNGDNQLVKEVKGRNTKNGRIKDQVWMNPYLFTKLGMWINPTFEVDVVMFVTDQMIRYRNDAGDAYKELSSAVMKIVPKDFMPKAMQKVGEAVNWVIFNQHEKMLRNKHGDEVKQRELWQLEKKIADLVNEGFINSFDALISYLRNQYQKRNDPQVFNCAS